MPTAAQEGRLKGWTPHSKTAKQLDRLHPPLLDFTHPRSGHPHLQCLLLTNAGFEEDCHSRKRLQHVFVNRLPGSETPPILQKAHHAISSCLTEGPQLLQPTHNTHSYFLLLARNFQILNIYQGLEVLGFYSRHITRSHLPHFLDELPNPVHLSRIESVTCTASYSHTLSDCSPFAWNSKPFDIYQALEAPF